MKCLMRLLCARVPYAGWAWPVSSGKRAALNLFAYRKAVQES
jgi:hypothetical protein